MSSQEPDDRRKLAQRVGEQGEKFVAQCLETQGWIVLHQRWRCRWGELDIIAQSPKPVKQLIFVEVKVRKPAFDSPSAQSNWDQNGLLSITPAKQRKLILASQAFLTSTPDLVSYDCRFDVALVTYRKKLRNPLRKELRSNSLTSSQGNNSIHPVGNGSENTGVDREALEFSIQHYIQGAFAAD